MKRIYFSMLLLASMAFLNGTLQAQNTLYSEDFESQLGEGLIGAPSTPVPNNTTYNASNSNWTAWTGPTSGILNDLDWAVVEDDVVGFVNTTLSSDVFQFRDVDWPTYWRSPVVNITGLSTVSLSLDVFEVGSLETSDSIVVSYILDGTPVKIYNQIDDFSDSDGTGSSSDTDPGNTNPLIIDVSASGLSGSTLQIEVKVDANSSSEIYMIDNVEMTTPDALPVEWMSFEVTPGEKSVALNWKADKEINNSHFEVERSADARSFTSIGKLYSKARSGGQAEYSFVDREPLSEVAYYRIRQVDFNGEYSFSPIRQVEFEVANSADLVIKSLRQRGHFQLEFEQAGLLTVEVMDIRGSLLLKLKDQDSRLPIELNLENYASGVYQLRIRDEKGNISGAKIRIR